MLTHQSHLVRRSLRASAIALFITTMPAWGDPATPQVVTQQGNEDSQLSSVLAASLRVSEFALISIEAPPVPGKRTEFAIDVAGKHHELSVWPHSVRAPDFEMYVNDPHRGLVRVDPGPVRTVRGIVKGDANSSVTGSISELGMNLFIRFGSGEARGLTAARRHVADAPAEVHAWYDMSQVLDEGGTCGTHEIEANGSATRTSAEFGVCEPEGPFIARLGCDAERTFLDTFQGTLAQKVALAATFIEENVDEVNQAVYELPPISTTHLIARMIIRLPDDTTYTTTISGDDLLDVIRSEWQMNHADAEADMVALWSGTDRDGNYVGRGRRGAVCRPSACWVEKRTGLYRLNLLAHELGHNWGAYHCDEIVPASPCTMCEFSCAVMRPNLVPCTNVAFSACTIEKILTSRLNYNCIEDTAFNGPTVRNEGVVVANEDTIVLPTVLSGETSFKTLTIENNMNCVVPIRMTFRNGQGRFGLTETISSLPPLTTVPFTLEFTDTFVGTRNADVTIETTGILASYSLKMNLMASTTAGNNLPETPVLDCPLSAATTPQPRHTSFVWEPTRYVESFQFQILSDTDQVLFNEQGLRTTSIRPEEASLPVGQYFTWKVTAHNANGATSAARMFKVDPDEATGILEVSYRDIPLTSGQTLNLPLNPDERDFDFAMRNTGSREFVLDNVELPTDFRARFVNTTGVGTGSTNGGGGSLHVIVKPCGTIILRMLFSGDPAVLSGGDPIMGTLRIDSSQLGIQFGVNLCFRCDPVSCVGDPFTGCGRITGVTQGGCWHFVADCGTEFGIRNDGSFSIGDEVFVAGEVDPEAAFCFPQDHLPQIPDSRVGTCITITGELVSGPPCYVDPCPLRIRTANGEIYDVENTTGFAVGDQVTVSGGFKAYSNFGNDARGLIFGNTIEAASGGKFERGG